MGGDHHPGIARVQYLFTWGPMNLLETITKLAKPDLVEVPF